MQKQFNCYGGKRYDAFYLILGNSFMSRKHLFKGFKEMDDTFISTNKILDYWWLMNIKNVYGLIKKLHAVIFL